MAAKTHYAKPGADNSFLHPDLDSGWASRDACVYDGEDSCLTTWLHRRYGEEYPVYAANGTQLFTFARGYSGYSRPTFINSSTLAVFHSGENGLCAGIYQTSGEQPRLLPCPAAAVYHTAAATLPNGDAYLVCGGVADDIGIYLFRKVAGEWLPCEKLSMDAAAVNRPQLAVTPSGKVYAAADCYRGGVYSIVIRELTNPDDAWQTLYQDGNWNMFPSIATAADGTLWACWLRQRTMRFKDVAGLDQKAMAARLENGRWQALEDVAELNPGLLPVKRYFGYDGLRRRPRLAAFSDGTVAMIWEQQKDEAENWDNLANGYLLGSVISAGGIAPPLVLAERGCCFAFDSGRLHLLLGLNVAAKSEHQPDGNDYVVQKLKLGRSPSYQAPVGASWGHWQADDFTAETCADNSGPGNLKVFWGDLHCHSIHSPDAEGEADELYHFARDIANLDFVALTDNDFYPTTVLLDSEVEYIAAAARAASTPEFLALSGYEWTFHRWGHDNAFNHRIVIFPPDSRLAARRNEAAGYTEESYLRYIRDAGYFHFPHHGYWTMLDNEAAVEIASGWGVYVHDADTVARNLNSGRRFSFLGNGDSHRFLPGLTGAVTGVLAEELSYKAIIEAIVAGRCFATTGNRTAGWFWVNDCFMGGSLQAVGNPLIKWAVRPRHELEYVKIIRDGAEAFISDCPGGEWQDKGVAPGRHWYSLEVKERGDYRRYPHNVASAWGKYLWMSPVYCEVTG